MPSGDVLRQLLRGYCQRDDGAFRAAAESLIREERSRNHRLLADDLERILRELGTRRGNAGGREHTIEVPHDRERGFPLVDIAYPDLDWGRLVLSSATLDTLKSVADEYHRADILAAAGLAPTRRALFYGPPGCGKTIAAHVLASAVSTPLLIVRFDAVVSSFLGETAANLRRVFDFIERGRWVVLFDEFDALGKDRDNPFEHGELKRVVNSILILMDAFRGESLLIAATNHESLLDSAIWRRFEAVVRFPPPTQQDRVLMLRLFLRSLDCSLLDLNSIARRMPGATGADVDLFAIEAARRCVLAGRRTLSTADTEAALRSFEGRRRVLRAARTGKASSTRRKAAQDPMAEDSA